MNTTRERPLAGKVALVTGGSRGIGAAIVLEAFDTLFNKRDHKAATLQ